MVGKNLCSGIEIKIVSICEKNKIKNGKKEKSNDNNNNNKKKMKTKYSKELNSMKRRNKNRMAFTISSSQWLSRFFKLKKKIEKEISKLLIKVVDVYSIDDTSSSRY